jgi:hypothetical protein
MHHVTFSAEEYALVHELLAARLADLRREIHHTDSREFRTFLVHREEVIANIVARLQEPEPVGR